MGKFTDNHIYCISVAGGAFFTLFLARPNSALSDLDRYPIHINSASLCLVCNTDHEQDAPLECERVCSNLITMCTTLITGYSVINLTISDVSAHRFLQYPRENGSARNAPWKQMLGQMSHSSQLWVSPSQKWQMARRVLNRMQSRLETTPKLPCLRLTLL